MEDPDAYPARVQKTVCARGEKVHQTFFCFRLTFHSGWLIGKLAGSHCQPLVGNGTMGNSLKDQFLKAGLVDANRAKAAKPARPKNSIQNRRKGSGAADAAKMAAQQTQAQVAERDRQLNLRRKEAQDKKALAAQLKQLIETNRLPKGEGDVAFQFAHRNKIQRLFVTEAVHKQIVAGSLAIVTLGKHYEIVPSAVAEKIRARTGNGSGLSNTSAISVVLYNDAQQTKDPDRDAEGDHPVPDDLMW